MKQEKANLRLSGRSFLAHIQEAAKEAGFKATVLRRDMVPRCGPLGGIYTGLVKSKTDAVLFLACDMPFVSARLIAEVAAKFRKFGGPVFVQHDGVCGFPCVIDRQSLPIVAQQIGKGDRSLQRLCKALGGRTVTVPKGRMMELFNVNTPADFETAREWGKLALQLDAKAACEMLSSG